MIVCSIPNIFYIYIPNDKPALIKNADNFKDLEKHNSFDLLFEKSKSNESSTDIVVNNISQCIEFKIYFLYFLHLLYLLRYFQS